MEFTRTHVEIERNAVAEWSLFQKENRNGNMQISAFNGFTLINGNSVLTVIPFHSSNGSDELSVVEAPSYRHHI